MATPIFKTNAWDRKVCKKQNLSWLFGAYTKIRPSGSLFGITQLPSYPRSDFFIHASHSWKSLIIFLSRLMSLNWFLTTELFLTYQFIKDRVIPILSEYRQNRPHITAQAFLLPTRDVWRHDAPNYWITSAVFYVYDVGLCNSDSKLQTSVDAVFVNKNMLLVQQRFKISNVRKCCICE